MESKFDDLSPELKEKLRACETTEELEALAAKESIELSLDELDTVAGGAGGANYVELEGRILEALPNAMFQVQLDDGNTVMCHISGKLRQNFIRIRPGDRVCVQAYPNDPSKGRIVWRCR